jgi:site-specific DNA-methyltransferase (adenine-specific)
VEIEIYNEECLAGMERIEAGSVDMILADLPYGVTANAWDSTIPLDELWAHYRRLIKPHGAIVLTGTQPFTGVLSASNLEWLQYEWIWMKSCPTGYLNAHHRPMPQHENILVFGESGKLATYNPQDLKPYNKIEKRGRPTSNYGTHERENFQAFTNYPRSLLFFPYDTPKLHPTQKPVALFEYLIRTYTNPGETVLDNCMGSGTTGVACVLSERNFIGFEMDEKYFQIAQKRIAETVAPENKPVSMMFWKTKRRRDRNTVMKDKNFNETSDNRAASSCLKRIHVPSD